MASIPAYMQMSDDIKRQILEGAYPPGSMLPTEAELGRQFHVSRTTVRRAVQILSRQGLVRVQQGYGTVVTDFRPRQQMNRITSLTETLRREGYPVVLRRFRVEIRQPPAYIAHLLCLPEGAQAACLQRIMDMDGKPLAIVQNYLSCKEVPGIEQNPEEISSLYRYMEDRYGIVLESARDRYSARNASPEEARLLEVPEGTALLYISRICFMAGEPVCVDQVSMLGDRYELELSMTGRERPDIRTQIL